MDIAALKDLIPEAEKFVLENDRARYKPLFVRAEELCAELEIVIGGRAGASLLLGAPLTKDSWVWDLYCANTYSAATRLIDALYSVDAPHVDLRTLTLMTKIKHREFSISVETRELFRVYTLDKYRDVSLVRIMNPVPLTGWFGSPVLVFPQSQVLIELYQNLYSPAKFKQWEESAASASALFQGATEREGAAEREGAFDRASADSILLRGLIRDPRIVLVGDYATALLGIGTGTRLQFLTDIPIAELAAMTSRVLNAEKDKLRRLKVSHERCVYVRYHLNIPSDFQITKHTLYAQVGADQIALADVFNSPEYELIPYTTVDKVRVGSPYVLLRFIFIDIWVVKLIIGLESAKRGGAGEYDCELTDTTPTDTILAGTSPTDNVRTDSAAEITGGAAGLSNRVEALLKLARKVREYIEMKMVSDPFAVFPRECIGVNMSKEVAKKKLISNIGYRIPNYYPAAKK